MMDLDYADVLRDANRMQAEMEWRDHVENMPERDLLDAYAETKHYADLGNDCLWNPECDRKSALEFRAEMQRRSLID